MKTETKRVVFYGYHDVGCRVLEALHHKGACVIGVVTHADDPGEEVWFRSVRRLAESLSLPVLEPESPNTGAVVEQVSNWRPDYIISAYYRKLLGPELLTLPRSAALNVHGSLLPRYRGRAPVNWVLVNGETETGVTLHHMTAEPDAGDIVAQETVKISDTDTVQSLFSKITRASGTLIETTWPALERGAVARTPQDPSQASHFGKRTPKDGRIDWRLGAKSVYNLVRAVTHPYPGAFTHFRGKPLWIWWATVGPESTAKALQAGRSADHKSPSGAAPGTVVDLDATGRIEIQTGADTILVERVEYEGVESTAGDFVRKHDIRRGERVGRES
jgi:methionyl-tRNA formyltransferase